MRPGRFTKTVVLLNCLVPAGLLAWDGWRGQLGANPVNFAIRTTGLLSLIFLTLTLAVTPISRVARLSWLGQFRRMMGLCAFFHATIHFMLFFGLDRNGEVRDTISEIVLRPYLMMGMTGLVLMVPLAATSTDRMIRRLGGKRWKALHRLTYVIAIAAVAHFYMLVKADVRRPIAFGGVIGLLLGYRLIVHYLQLRSDSNLYRSGVAAGPRADNSVPAQARPWKGRLRVARIFQETPSVRTFRLISPDGERLPFEYLPGQYLNIALMIDGKRISRSYTIASAPSRGRACEITVKREEFGVASRHLHERVREGDLLEISAPAGRFYFTGSEAPGIVLIAGGVGITPLMSKIRYLTDVGWSGRIDLLYAAKSEEEIIFRGELEHLKGRFPNLKVTMTLSRDDNRDWTGERGRITADMLKRAVPDLQKRRIHLCGPTPMMDATRKILAELGVPQDQVHTESFERSTNGDPIALPEMAEESAPAVSKGSPSNDDAVAASITFLRSGRSKPVGSDQTILEASEEIGVNIPYDCRAGICGRCKTRLISGRVVMDSEDALDDRDRAAKLILSCQARCVDEVVVDI